MANNYTHFSFHLPLTPEQVAALTALQERVDAIIFGEAEPSSEWEESLTDHSSSGFTIHEAHDGVIIASDDDGNVELVIDLMQTFIQQHAPDLVVGFEWANTCDKKRPGQFGGGAVVITATDITSMNTSLWLDQQLKKT